MQKFYDKLLLAAAVLVLLLAAAWVFFIDGAGASAGGTMFAPTKSYQPIGMDAPEVKTEVWERPRSQKSGPEWVYDLFTPPVIYYDVATKKFTVTPPLIGEQPVKVEVFPVALVQVKQDVFPLQLIGYVGEGQGARGTFENTKTGETFLGRGGKKVPDLGLTIESLEVKRHRIESEGSMTLHDTIATAVVVDDSTGVRVTLTNKQRLTQGAPFAVLRLVETGEQMELRAGAEFNAGGYRYTLLSVGTDSVEIEQKSENPETPAVKKTLTAEGGAAPISAHSENSEPAP